jgi:hypothetical protein
MLFSKISSSLHHSAYIHKLFLCSITKQLHPSFKYAICGIQNISHHFTPIRYEINVYLLLDYEYVEEHPDHWNRVFIWLLKARYHFCKEDENPLFNRERVTANSNTLFEKGTLINAVQHFVYQKILYNGPIHNTIHLCSIFHRDTPSYHTTAIIIEECSDSIRYPFLHWCINAKHCGVLHPARLPYIANIHIIYPKKEQTYHTFGLERNTHYSITIQNIDLFKWIVNALGKNVIEHFADCDYTESENVCVINDESKNRYPFEDIYEAMKSLKKTRILKNRNNAWLVSYGYSGRVREYAGGPPQLTNTIAGKSGNNLSLLQLALPILQKLSEEILIYFGNRIFVHEERNLVYAQTLGENFNLTIDGLNLFEGLDFAITSGVSNNLLSPHCDVMNDWRPGCNFCSVAKGIVTDNETNRDMQIVIIAYTRKDVGDYIYGASNYLL